MSMELHVLFSKNRLPDIGLWQAAIDSHGFEVKLDPDRKVGADSGFLPATFKGRESGFEFSVGPAAGVVSAYPSISAITSGFDTVGNFRWGGDFDEMACALSAAAGLASLSGGIWFDPQEGECRDVAGAISEARAGILAAGW